VGIETFKKYFIEPAAGQPNENEVVKKVLKHGIITLNSVG